MTKDNEASTFVIALVRADVCPVSDALIRFGKSEQSFAGLRVLFLIREFARLGGAFTPVLRVTYKG